MTNNRTAKARRAAASEHDMSVGRDDAEDGVIITRTGVYPAALRRAMSDPETREVVEGLQDAAAMIEQARQILDQVVPIARHAGLSWDSIGWLVGLSGTQAQARWGTAKQGAR